MKVLTHDSLVTPIRNAFCSNVKELPRYRFNPRFCPKQPKWKSPLNFTLCTLQSHFPRGKIRAFKCRLRVKDSPLTLKAICLDANETITLWCIILSNSQNRTSSSKISRIGPVYPFRLQSYSCSLQRFFGLPIVLLPCGL